MIIIIIVSAVSGIYIFLNQSKEEIILNNPEPVAEESPITEKTIEVTTNVAEPKTIPSYEHLFEVKKPSPEFSNIVGYFGKGAFAWYVPDWLVANWKMEETTPTDIYDGMYFVPNEQIAEQSLSPITIDVTDSTENYNAQTLFEKEKETLGKVVLTEILLNAHQNSTLKLLIEEDTRIYHIQSEFDDYIRDLYFIDGNDRTARISFSADKANFHLYTNKIKELVEGIGELKEPRG